jgi:predicted nucleotidyltransferase
LNEALNLRIEINAVEIIKNDKVLNIFLQEIQRQLGSHLKQVILFGSRARGDFTPDSDYDCLLVMDKITPDTEDIINEIAGDLLYYHNAVFSLFPILAAQYSYRIYNPLLMNVRKEGIILWPTNN